MSPIFLEFRQAYSTQKKSSWDAQMSAGKTPAGLIYPQINEIAGEQKKKSES